jgi:hypothetical protein
VICDSPGKQISSLALRRLSGPYFWRAHKGVWDVSGGGWVPGEGLEGLTSLKAKRIEKVTTVWCSIKCHPRNPGKKEEQQQQQQQQQQQLSALTKRGTWKAERGTWINLRPGGDGSGGRWRCWKRQTNWPHEGIRDSRPQCRRSHVARNHHGQPWKESLGRAQSPIFEV